MAVLDADRVKDFFLRDALEQDFYDDLLDVELADAHPLMPRELATLVHTESTIIIDAIAERCVNIGENVVMEGTFSWPGLGRRPLSELAEADDQKLKILDIEAPQDIMRARALNRWWRRRETALRCGDPLGGRFTPGLSSTPSTRAATY